LCRYATCNFRAIMRYNPSTSYAMSVAILVGPLYKLTPVDP
jgi:membrane-bound lytic murein transglycosylase B